jgi:hypothetical protein
MKQYVINYIYSKVDMAKYKYKLIEYEHDLSQLKETKFYVSPNYNGIASLLVFMKIRDKFYSLLIDRRTLNYDKNKINIDEIKIMQIDIRLDLSIYDGTIIDGVLLYNYINKMKHYVVNDLYFFRGKDMAEENINDKMLNMDTYLNTFMKKDNVVNNIGLVVNKLYKLNEINELVNVYIPKSTYSSTIKGLAFFPEVSATKLIYLYNNCVEVKDQKIDEKNIRKTNIEIGDKDITAIFKIKKSDIIDVYWLYVAKKEEDNGKTVLKYNKYMKAFLPTQEISHFCNDLLVGTKSALVECKYLHEKCKWVPIKLASDKKRPFYKEEVDKLLNIE